MPVLWTSAIGIMLLTIGSLSAMSGQLLSMPSQPQEKQFQPTSQAAGRRAEIQRANTLNADQKKHLEAEADRLIELANALKHQIGTTGPGGLSVDAIKNANEAEKLAHSIGQGLKRYPYLPSVP
jgi:regulator of protease activity HflC (stomatin/prohibitin superfamily)